MSLNQTPSGERIHIGIFGKRNAGKSSIMNAIAGQEAAIVSAQKGTTTDPVYKAMELLPLGPVVWIDTPGWDDEGDLGALRVKKAKAALQKSDLALLIIDASVGKCQVDRQLEQELKERRLPYLLVYNKCDLCVGETSWEKREKREETDAVWVSAHTGEGIWELKERIAQLSPEKDTEKRIVGDFLKPLDLVVLVIPIDKAAPKGRLILPQQQTIRDILEAGAIPVVTRETELKETLARLTRKPKLVITDSQVFEKVNREVPEDISLTSFSILFARYKGNLEQAAAGAQVLEGLADGDSILISEGCTHHRQCGDIGTEKLPKWIQEHTGRKLQFTFTSGAEFPEQLGKYRLVVHCGGCMLNASEMQYRLMRATAQKVPVTNYGVLIAYMKGIWKRSARLFVEEEVTGEEERISEEGNAARKEDEGKGELERKLRAYGASDFYGFHMPGHKRQMRLFADVYGIDITEIDGFDDLHHPQADGVLTKAQRRAARIYGAEETHFLVNGSTAGILAAVSGCTAGKGKILMARNCHRSVYHAAELRGLQAIYLYPHFVGELGINGGIDPADVEKALALDSEIQAVLITSPTYDGVCSDVRAIAGLCHQYKKPLIVDQAHGAHFPFSEYFPEDAVKAGADVVIHSVHKTLPALTQTALLHIQGELVDRQKLCHYLSVYQTSSPSYVLMASIDACMNCMETQGEALFEAHARMLEEFRQGCGDLKLLSLEGAGLPGQCAITDYDRSKLLIRTGKAGISGEQLHELLRARYHLQMELEAPSYVLGIASVADSEEGFLRLSKALHELDRELFWARGQDRAEEKKVTASSVKNRTGESETDWLLEMRRQREQEGFPVELSIGEAQEREWELVKLTDSPGRTAATYIYLYPPGIPLLVPGERIVFRAVEQIAEYERTGLRVKGLEQDLRIAVLK